MRSEQRGAADPAAGTLGGLTADIQSELGDADPVRARELVAALLDVPRYWTFMHAAEPVTREIHAEAFAAARRLMLGAPLAYAVRRAPFRNLTLDVDERVLIPRPETEQLVDEVLRLAGNCTGIAADIGTGSGAIALSLASEGAFERVIATDVSLDALAVARRNIALHAPALHAAVELRHGSFLAPLRAERIDVLVSNPPYIADWETISLPASVRDWEPPVALLAGADGMGAITAIVRDAPGVLRGGGIIALEVDSRRASLAAELVAVAGCFRDVTVRLDLAGRERFVLARRI